MTSAAVHTPDLLTWLDPAEVREAALDLEGRPAEAILAWAVDAVPRMTVTSSFGADSAVLLHLLSRVAPQVPVLFLETGLHFEETLTHRDQLAERLGLSVVDVRPPLSVDEQARQHGEALWERDPDACCAMRKTVPLRQTLGRFDGWATAVRRSQTPDRANLPVVEVRDHDGRAMVKVAPLATWSDTDVQRYLIDHDLPRHPLVAEGYPSIGCAPCTAKVEPGSDPRSGRWATFAAKTECGIHVTDEGTIRSTAPVSGPAPREV